MYYNICTTIIVFIILILGEIWRKGRKFKSLLHVDVFAEVTNVNTEALYIDSTNLGKNIADGVLRENVFSYSYLGFFYLPRQENAEMRGLLLKSEVTTKFCKNCKNIHFWPIFQDFQKRYFERKIQLSLL